MSISSGEWATGVCGPWAILISEPAPGPVVGSWVLVMGDWGSARGREGLGL